MADKKLLLEIGTEEIPARFLPIARTALPNTLKELLKEHYIDYDNKAAVYATPRRLAVILQIADRQLDRVREAFGPPRSAAYNEDGTFTRAAIGFARSQGIEPGDLIVKSKGRGEYVSAVVKEKGRPTEELLPDILKRLILSLHFPKSMRWGDGELRFARPIHWIVALLGDKAVEFDLDGIKSGKMSRGHRFLAPDEFQVSEPDSYVGLLKERFVIVDQAERVDIITKSAEALCKSISGEPFYVADDHPLIVADLVEYPQPVLGSFDEKYLELPDELLNSVMWGHQKYFSVVNNNTDNELKNSFIIVSNTLAENDKTVRRGAERVIRARFEDARFYYQEDRKKTLASQTDELKRVTFQERLGSLHQKAGRLSALAAKVAALVSPAAGEHAVRAAELCKVDLISGVVKEFPELQGVMGRYYAAADGEPAAVAAAIAEHYLPAYSGDMVPPSDAGAVLALADRMDNVAAFFAIGLRPTGSEDPFALRRQALGVISILKERGYTASLSALLDAAIQGLSTSLEAAEDTRQEVMGFLSSRVEGTLLGEGYAHDLVQAVISMATEVSLSDLGARLEALSKFKSHDEYNDFLIAIKRVRNIIPKGELPEPVAGLYRESQEHALAETFSALAEGVRELVGRADYYGAIERMLALNGPVNEFFDHVLVMDEDEALKLNRLGLLQAIWSMVCSVADLSKLSETA